MIHTDLYFQNLPIILNCYKGAYYASIILTKKCAYYAQNYASIIYQPLVRISYCPARVAGPEGIMLRQCNIYMACSVARGRLQ